MLGRFRDGALADRLRPGIVLPIVLAVALVLLVVAGALLGARAAAVGRSAIGDTGPVLVGAELPGDGSAGPPAVSLSAAAAVHPESGAVRDLLQRWTDARNAGDLTAYRAALVPEARIDPATFAATARTQRVGSVVVRRIDPVAGGELVVPLGYVTTQDPAVAPPDVRVPRLCWQVSAVVETGGGAPRLVDPRPGSQLRTPC
ncbi:hypothetical protein Acsp06_55350 [Actinomycetospora sp. NBRC 106375]|uniref:hypothetical protein n=1 Tax=Actinomycetospora sp. NBRC 106375 TaxID=3032207 RepID=UPI0024A60475|nr:hypothetical protein [Actinomycetospora sp. NBRC 106375]GLZ49350.1 hypothetical protein Acsp06_55350 [Actinomycetospora sp. NBRC 106375]